MKPQIPKEIEDRLPLDVVKHIYSFVPHNKKPKKDKTPQLGFTVSPYMERDLRLLQSRELRGKNELWMRDLEEFVLT
jgi:hypothetical protein